MDESETFFSKTFTISQKHIDFLNKINENASIALRTVLDSIIRNDKRSKIIEEVKNLLYFFSFGAILILISYTLTDILRFISMSIGFSILIYGVIMGVYNAIRFSKKI